MHAMMESSHNTLNEARKSAWDRVTQCTMMTETFIGYACRVHYDVNDNHDEHVCMDGGYACQDRLLW